MKMETKRENLVKSKGTFVVLARDVFRLSNIYFLNSI
jgi:hypothetical protein